MTSVANVRPQAKLEANGDQIRLVPPSPIASGNRPNTVVTVVQKGYTLNGRLVRPAMVIVSQATAGKLDEKA